MEEKNAEAYLMFSAGFIVGIDIWFVVPLQTQWKLCSLHVQSDSCHNNYRVRHLCIGECSDKLILCRVSEPSIKPHTLQLSTTTILLKFRYECEKYKRELFLTVYILNATVPLAHSARTGGFRLEEVTYYRMLFFLGYNKNFFLSRRGQGEQVVLGKTLGNAKRTVCLF